MRLVHQRRESLSRGLRELHHTRKSRSHELITLSSPVVVIVVISLVLFLTPTEFKHQWKDSDGVPCVDESALVRQRCKSGAAQVMKFSFLDVICMWLAGLYDKFQMYNVDCSYYISVLVFERVRLNLRAPHPLSGLVRTPQTRHSMQTRGGD